MPELPEIETVKLQLQKVLTGLTLQKIEVRNYPTVQGNAKSLEGQQVIGIRRRAKVLIIDFTSHLSMAFHFKMTGQLIYVNGDVRIAGGHPTEDFVGQLPSVHTRAIFEFSQGMLYFNDQRLFGWVKIGKTEDINELKFLQNLGPEPFDVSPADFVVRVSKSRRPIKVVIMDQEVLSGVGNIYANDALWEAEINPKTPAAQVPAAKLEVLLEKIKLVLTEGIKYGGATAADAKYIDLHGLGGHYQDHFRTYDRTGKPCLRCKTPITRIELAGRGTYFCSQCQP